VSTFRDVNLIAPSFSWTFIRLIWCVSQTSRICYSCVCYMYVAAMNPVMLLYFVSYSCSHAGTCSFTVFMIWLHAVDEPSAYVLDSQQISWSEEIIICWSEEIIQDSRLHAVYRSMLCEASILGHACLYLFKRLDEYFFKRLDEYVLNKTYESWSDYRLSNTYRISKTTWSF
jgi:hypothetical protein